MDKFRNMRDKFDGDFSLGQLFVLRIRSTHLRSAGQILWIFGLSDY